MDAALISWLVVTTVVAVVVRGAGIPSAIRATEWITHPAIRRLAQRVTAVSIVASSVTSPMMAAATEAPPTPVEVVGEVTEPVIVTPSLPENIPVTPPIVVELDDTSTDSSDSIANSSNAGPGTIETGTVAPEIPPLRIIET
jgi:hypothetical protein